MKEYAFYVLNFTGFTFFHSESQQFRTIKQAKEALSEQSELFRCSGFILTPCLSTFLMASEALKDKGVEGEVGRGSGMSCHICIYLQCDCGQVI